MKQLIVLWFMCCQHQIVLGLGKAKFSILKFSVNDGKFKNAFQKFRFSLADIWSPESKQFSLFLTRKSKKSAAPFWFDWRNVLTANDLYLVLADWFVFKDGILWSDRYLQHLAQDCLDFYSLHRLQVYFWIK